SKDSTSQRALTRHGAERSDSQAEVAPHITGRKGRDGEGDGTATAAAQGLGEARVGLGGTAAEVALPPTATAAPVVEMPAPKVYEPLESSPLERHAWEDTGTYDVKLGETFLRRARGRVQGESVGGGDCGRYRRIQCDFVPSRTDLDREAKLFEDFSPRGG
ncbi:unnamed protein product, partial [Discosporangium mesarthrocarpum]